MFRIRRLSLSYILRMTICVGLFCLPMLAQGILHSSDSPYGVTAFFLLGSAFLGLVIMLRMRVWMMVPLVLLSLVYVSYMLVFQTDISYNEVAAVMNTHPSEALEYIKNWRVGLSLAGVAVVMIILAWLLCRKKTWSWSRREVPVPRFTPLLVFLVGLAAFIGPCPGWWELQVYPAKIIYETASYWNDVYYARKKYMALKYEYQGPKEESLPEKINLVLIVGESARLANWSLYGYDRQTNPLLEERFAKAGHRAVLFTDPVSSGRLTMNSVASMLSPLPAKEFAEYYNAPSLVRIFREGGFHTTVISSQDHNRYWSGPPMLMLSGAHSEMACCNPETDTPGYDEDILPGLDQYLRTNQKRRLIIIHLSGSHYDYDSRYPSQWAFFDGRGSWMDTYDDSLRYTDFVLDEVLKRFENSDTPTLVIHSSDHGENFNDFGDGNFQHSCRHYVTCFEVEVPFFTYVNSAFEKKYPEQTERLFQRRALPISHDNIAHTLLGIAGLKDMQVYRPALNLTGERFKVLPRHFIVSVREIISEKELRESPYGMPEKTSLGK